MATDEMKMNNGADADHRDRRQNRNSRMSGGGGANRSNRGGGGTMRMSSGSSGNRRSRSPQGGRRNRAPSSRRIYVANIAYDCKWTVIKDLFREKVGEVSYVEFFEDDNGKFNGCGIVEFKDAASVTKAVDELHRFEFKGRHLVVKEDYDVERDRTGRPASRRGPDRDRDDRDDYSRGRGGGTMRQPQQPQFNTFGLSPQFLDSLGIEGPLTCRIFVANLDYKVTPSKLEEVFHLAGKVISVDLKRDEDGNSKGHGTIEMGHPVEAVQAISMFNGQRFFNRSMSVRMDKKQFDDTEEKRLPEGLQGVGKGLGANGLPLHLSNPAGNANSMSQPTALSSVGSLGGGAGLGLLSNQMPVGGSSTGIPGLAGIGMGLQDRNFSLTSGMGGVTSAGGLGLGTNASSALGGMSSSLLSGGMAGLSSNTSLGNSLTGGMGLGGLQSGGSSSLGFSDFDSRFDRVDDSYRNKGISDTIVVRNLPTQCTWENVRDRFADYGNVRNTQMKGRGVAVIQFSNDREAQRALEHIRTARIFGRLLDASYY